MLHCNRNRCIEHVHTVFYTPFLLFKIFVFFPITLSLIPKLHEGNEPLITDALEPEILLIFQKFEIPYDLIQYPYLEKVVLRANRARQRQ